MNQVDLISKKRDGSELTPDELNYLITEYVAAKSRIINSPLFSWRSIFKA